MNNNNKRKKKNTHRSGLALRLSSTPAIWSGSLLAVYRRDSSATIRSEPFAASHLSGGTEDLRLLPDLGLRDTKQVK